ncbi:peptidylprolyl isomerase [Deinococcus cavernae]|nr:peptidylprolyl isomerase [Deinococcus cavernae]
MWNELLPEHLLVIDTTRGRLLVEMCPELAPRAVERVKLLAREGVYNGLQFHRVIDGFVAQTGNPNNRGGGASHHPDLLPEFSARLPLGTAWTCIQRTADFNAGFLGTLPVLTTSDAETARQTDGKVQVWGAYCPGVAGMGRQHAPDSANSEIFFMRGSAFRLNLNFTAWGNVVVGREVVEQMAVGEPPASPDLMLRVQVASDMAQRPRVEAMDTNCTAFRELVQKTREARGADFSLSDVQVPTRLI